MDLEYGKQYEDYRVEVQEFCKKYKGVQFNDTAKIPLASNNKSGGPVMSRSDWQKILIENGKQIGLILENNEIYEGNEIIVSAGAVESPKLLLLSGVGKKDELDESNIEHVHDLPGVGKNLQDHIDYLSVHKYNSIELIGFSLKSIFGILIYSILHIMG